MLEESELAVQPVCDICLRYIRGQFFGLGELDG